MEDRGNGRSFVHSPSILFDRLLSGTDTFPVVQRCDKASGNMEKEVAIGQKLAWNDSNDHLSFVSRYEFRMALRSVNSSSGRDQFSLFSLSFCM